MKKWFFIAILWFLSWGVWAAPSELKQVQLSTFPPASRFTFLLTKKTHGQVIYQPQHQKLIVEMADTKTQLTIPKTAFIKANVLQVSIQQTPSSLRFIFYLLSPIHWHIEFLPKDSSNQARLLLTIRPDKIIAKLTEKKIKALPQLKSVMQPRPQLKGKNIFTVVIDAGHGGKDPGASGLHGGKEKNVVLAIAKALADRINQQPNMRAVLTRRGDYFVPLRERLKLARKGKADLFVAIHADAYFNATATGASVYALSQHGATSEAARWLAHRDNESELGGVEFSALQDRSLVLRSVLIDLEQTVTIRDSLRLGNRILDALDNISSLHYQRVEQAPFVVLKSPDIPSVLVEVGFMTNPAEERRLLTAAYQQHVAQALMIGIKQYVQKYGMLRVADKTLPSSYFHSIVNDSSSLA